MQALIARIPVWLVAVPLLALWGCGPSTPSADPPGDTAAPPTAAPETAAPPALPPSVPPAAAPGASTPPPPTTMATGSPAGRPIRFRFVMDTPANDDFAFYDDEVHIYVRPYEDNLAIRIKGREQNFLRVYWDESEFTDVLGRRYRIVPSDIDFSQATYGIPPTDIPPGTLYAGRLLLLDPTDVQAIQRLGGRPFPVVPPDAGSPDQMRGQVFELDLEIEVNGARRSYPFTFAIREAYYQ